MELEHRVARLELVVILAIAIACGTIAGEIFGPGWRGAIAVMVAIGGVGAAGFWYLNHAWR